MKNKRRAPRDTRVPPWSRTRLQGVVYLSDHGVFGVRANKWPKKMGPAKTPKHIQLVKNFTELARSAGYISPMERAAAEEWARGTIYTWRDLYSLAANGKLVTVYDADGNYYAGWRIMASDIQAMLDTIATAPGTILIRGASQWGQLQPGTAGYVLTSQGPSQPPDWAKGGGGGGGAGWCGAIGLLEGSGSPSTSGYACKGNIYTAYQQGRLNGVTFWDGISGQTEEYNVWAAIVDDTYKVLKVISGTPLTLTTNAIHWWQFHDVLEFQPGDLVAWGLALTTAPTNTPCGVIFPSVNGDPLPGLLYRTSVRAPLNVPAAGDTLTTVLGSHVLCQFSYELYNSALAGA